jgi:adenylate cyclase
MHKFLVVDDEESVERLINQRFRREIRNNEYSFLFARDGEDALDTLKEHQDIEIIITDINMPRMDGLTLLNHVQEINPVVKTIMISAYGDLENIRASMNRGAFDFITKPIDFDDLRATMDKTLRFVSDIKESLRTIKENNLLKMYVNPSVFTVLNDTARQLTEGLRRAHESGVANAGHQDFTQFSERVTATVCFIDICGFTRLSEELSPDLIAHLLNRYFDEIARTVTKYGGTIDKFIGDAAMVVFRDGEHSEQAIKAVLEIQEKLTPMQETEIAPGFPYPGISAGINAGEMLSGNYGSPELGRMDFTVIGDVVNTAARIENLSPCGHVIITDELARRLDGQFQLESLGSHSMKNKAKPIELFRVIS